MSRLDRWQEPEAATAAFASRGFASAADKAKQLTRAARRLAAAGVDGTREAHAFFVPGRIEVLGKHTDYCGGRSLVAATEQGFCLVAVPRDDARVRVTDAAAREEATFDLDPELAPPRGHWSNYPMTVARRLARNFPDARRGVDLAFCSDLPAAAGMSSSSAFIIAAFLALRAVNHLAEHPDYRRNIPDDLSLAEYLGTNENGQSYRELQGDRGVGTFGGSEDHTGILCSEPGSLGQFAYCPTRFERRVAVPEGYVFAIGSSGVVAEKTGAALERYNRVSARAAALVDAWTSSTGREATTLAAIVEQGEEAIAELGAIVRRQPPAGFAEGELQRRLDQFCLEHLKIVGQAGEALDRGDLGEFKRLVIRSQRAGADMLENQVEETVALATMACDRYAEGASGFGAGFGGSVWALVRAAEAPAFLEQWERDYRARFPERGEALFLTTGAGSSAFELA